MDCARATGRRLNMTQIEVKTCAGFINQGVYAKRGATITVDLTRARELRLNRLVEPFDESKVVNGGSQTHGQQFTPASGGEKGGPPVKTPQAEKPSNKRRGDPQNKGAGDSGGD